MQYEPLIESPGGDTLLEPSQEAQREQSIAPPPPEAEPSLPTKHDSNDAFSTEGREERLSGLMLDVLQGNIGRGRSLKYWENLKLNPSHVQMLVMKAAGYNNRAIARQFGYTEARVSVIVNHPDAMTVLSRLVSMQAENLLDIKARIQAHSGEALDAVLTAMRTAEKPIERAAIGFKLLDRAGYGAVQKVDHSVRFEMPAAEAHNLTAALQESQEVQDAEWSIVSEHAGRAGGVGDSEEREASVGADQSDIVSPPHDGQLVPLRRTA